MYKCDRERKNEMMMIWLPSMNAYALWTRQMDMISVNECTVIEGESE